MYACVFGSWIRTMVMCICKYRCVSGRRGCLSLLLSLPLRSGERDTRSHTPETRQQGDIHIYIALLNDIHEHISIEIHIDSLTSLCRIKRERGGCVCVALSVWFRRRLPSLPALSRWTHTFLSLLVPHVGRSPPPPPPKGRTKTLPNNEKMADTDNKVADKDKAAKREADQLAEVDKYVEEAKVDSGKAEQVAYPLPSHRTPTRSRYSL